jgi:hypothetical protein
LGIYSGVQKRRKIPAKNKNNADRQRFEGGFVKANSPFDYPGYEKSAHNEASPTPPFSQLCRRT